MRLDQIDTPAILIDLDLVDGNLARVQAYADANGLALRPHMKTHKLPRFALQQLALGAVGITCQKLGEAEVMADAGVADIFLPYNILGAAKLARLRALHDRIEISVTADSRATVAGYAQTMLDAPRPLPVLIECDTGMGRCGVQTPEEALDLARLIDAAPGLRFDGLMTYPARGKAAETQEWLSQAAALLTEAGLPPRRISNGGTPDMFQAAAVTSATEHRPGTYIYGDRMQVALGHGALEHCALTVLATVISRPTPTRAVLDAGSKALAADLCEAPGHGHLPAWPEAVVTALSEEHAVVDLSACQGRLPQIGERVRVIPNHVCVVTNLFDEAHLMRGEEVEEIVPIAARGLMR